MRGEVRNPMQVWLLIFLTCGVYGFFWWYTIGEELKNFLGKEDLNPALDVLIGVLCGFYMWYLPIKYGKLIQEAQRRAGNPNAEDQGIMFLLLMFLFGYGYVKMQEELNKVWESGGGAPATGF